MTKFIGLFGIDPEEPKNKMKLNEIANLGALGAYTIDYLILKIYLIDYPDFE